MGIRFQLHHQRETDDPVIYRGTIDGDWCCSIEVTVDDSGAVASAPDAPEDRRADIERAAAVMVRSAVRRALREQMPPPRRIQRWREG